MSDAAKTAHAPLMCVRDLTKHFTVGKIMRPGSGRTVHAVEDVVLDVYRGETLGLVGESGSGKSTLGRCMTRLYEPTSGSLTFDGQDISRTGERGLLPVRRRMQMIFQDPSASLNPRRRVRDLVGEAVRVHGIRKGRAVEDWLRELMDIVGLRAEYLDRYPHEFSGGQRQRIGIARALATNPALIIADEPVSALDVSVQAQVINLMEELREEFGLTYIFVAHDLAIVYHIADRIAVMYLGDIVELGPAEEICNDPRHPYTRALLSSVPQPDPRHDTSGRIRLEGDIPSPLAKPSGCGFRTRCPIAKESCAEAAPEWIDLGEGRGVGCPHTSEL